MKDLGPSFDSEQVHQHDASKTVHPTLLCYVDFYSAATL